jgi:hypothetical protein
MCVCMRVFWRRGGFGGARGPAISITWGRRCRDGSLRTRDRDRTGKTRMISVEREIEREGGVRYGC